jgi:hypothetical protein
MDQINNKPETELPWNDLPHLSVHYDYSDKDESYILHACNAYPELIEMVREAAWIPADQTAPSENKTVALMAIDLLRKLGEDV